MVYSTGPALSGELQKTTLSKYITPDPEHVIRMKRSREPDEAEGYASSGSRNLADSVDDRLEPSAKIIHVAGSGEDHESSAMKCSLPPHKEALNFASYEEYESHYNQAHTNRCSECRKNLPTAHLLNLHVEECHDPFAAQKRDKGEHTFACFVEDCERKCLTPQKRRMHLIDKHMYPRNYFFAVTRDGIDNRQSLLVRGHHRRRRSSTSKPLRRQSNGGGQEDPLVSIEEAQTASTAKRKAKDAAEGAEATESMFQDSEDEEMEDLTGQMSALKFVPPSIKFGRGAGGKAGFARS